MAEIPPLRPVAGVGGSPPVIGDPSTAPDLPFSVGQRLFARVVQVLGDNSALLEMAGQRFTTSTPTALSTGQIIEVAVRGAGGVVDLELLDPPETISERAYALASVLEAKQATSAAVRVPADAIRTLLQSLHGAVPRDLPAPAPDLAARAAAALLPVRVDADGARLAEDLRHAVRASGAFLEARLAAAPRGGGFDPSHVADEVRVILGEMATHTAGSPALEATRAALAADVLARQADVAYHAVRDGEIRLDVPVQTGVVQTDVRLCVREEPGAADRDPASTGRQIDLTLELPQLGRVRATLAWTPGHLTTRFAVADATQAEALTRELSAFDARLHAVGFRQVATRVDVDPEALAPADVAPEPLLPGGSILRVRA